MTKVHFRCNVMHNLCFSMFLILLCVFLFVWCRRGGRRRFVAADFFFFFYLANFTFSQPVCLVYQKCTWNDMKLQPGVWMKQLKILFCSAGEQEVAEEEEAEAGEGQLYIYIQYTVYMYIYYCPCRLSCTHNIVILIKIITHLILHTNITHCSHLKNSPDGLKQKS